MKKHRYLSLLLAAVMCMSVTVPVYADASDTDDIAAPVQATDEHVCTDEHCTEHDHDGSADDIDADVSNHDHTEPETTDTADSEADVTAPDEDISDVSETVMDDTSTVPDETDDASDEMTIQEAVDYVLGLEGSLPEPNGIFGGSIDISREDADIIKRVITYQRTGLDPADPENADDTLLTDSATAYAKIQHIKPRGSNDYYYDQLCSTHKKIYDAMAAVAEEFSNSNRDLIVSDELGIPLLLIGLVDIEYDLGCTISEEEYRAIWTAFKMSNPQYWSIAQCYSLQYEADGDIVALAFTALDEATYASSRKSYQSQIDSKTNTWLGIAENQSSELKKVEKLEELIGSGVVYNTDNKEDPKNHTMLSIFCCDKTVCEGYILAMTYLCDLAGIDCIGLCYSPSDTCRPEDRNISGHAWNRVKIDGTWYEAELTWYDQYVDNGWNYNNGRYIYPEQWLNTSTVYLKGIDETSRIDHDTSITALYSWSFDGATVHLPECTHISPYAPIVNGSMSGGKVYLTWKAIEGATKYTVYSNKGSGNTYYKLKETASNYAFIELSELGTTTCSSTDVQFFMMSDMQPDDHFPYCDDITVSVLGHTPGVPVISWAADGKSCTGTVTCKNCGSTIADEYADIDNGKITSIVETEATSSDMGWTRYKVSFEDEMLKKLPYADGQSFLLVQDIPKIIIDYRYAEPTYTWSGTDSCTAVAVSINGGPTITENGTITSVVKTAATCGTVGTTTYTAVFTDPMFTAQTKDADDIPATGKHSYPYVWSDEYSWSSTHMNCSASATCRNCGHTIYGYATVTKETTKEPTCTETGTCTYTATFSSSTFTTQTYSEPIPALGHSWYEPSYSWSSTGSYCYASVSCSRCSTYVTEYGTITSKVKTPATSETMGTTTYTATFTKAPFTVQTKDIQDIPVVSYTYGEPTYTWYGYDSCRASAMSSDGGPEIFEWCYYPTLTVITSPTCTTTGFYRYEADFTNSRFTTQYRYDSNVPAIGHDYGSPSYVWASDGSSCTATAVCSRCEAPITENAVISSSVLTEATSDSMGVTRYTASFSHSAFTEQTKDIQDIPVLSDYTIEYTWAPDNSGCSAVMYTPEGEPYSSEEATLTSSVYIEPTCTAAGWTLYKATFTDEQFYAQYRYVQDIPATGVHAYSAPTYQWAEDHSSCTASKVCSMCGDTISETAEAASYTYTRPTCTAMGQTRYYATYETEGFVYQGVTLDDIPKKPHDYEYEYVWNEDYSFCTANATCKDCGHEAGPAGNTRSRVKTPPTCADMGITTYYIEFSEYEYMYPGIQDQSVDVKD
ncbi:MAG: hypothetical protein IKR73_05490, partial [Oscillospiraceae bacterium]|nr:hypothetical protein [Oscillospiraceae bacterium]